MERMGDEKLIEIRCPESGGKREARKMKMRREDSVNRD